MAAKTSALGALHELVAATLAADLEAAQAIEDPALRVMAIDKARAQAITFLKNNSITADVEQDDRLRALRERLAEKRQTAKQSLADAAEQFATEHAGGLMQ